ncbi:MAG TPA: PAS domain S-box protein [Rhizobacter sp.]|nr:PAS domain S-box protein [Rhizobacter sp.]
MDESAKFTASLSDEGRARLLIDAITDYAICMLDTTGHVTSWNPGAQRFKGYAAAEIIGQHFSRFYTPEDLATGLPERALAQARSEGKFEEEGWRVRKDGSRFWAHIVIDPVRDPAGRLVGFAKITHDLTERKAAEESLRSTEQQFRLLVQGVTDYAIYMIDGEGRVNSWNAGAERIKGYTPAEIIGQHFSRFYRPEDQARGEPVRALATARSEGRYEAEGWRVRKDGSHFWANVVIDAIRDDQGEVIGFAKITRDVTAKHESQQALEQARESLFQSQKLDAIGQLTGGVAHDFNNLLMVILSSLELLRRRIGDDPKLNRLLDNAVRGAKRGASLTQRMLSFARRQDLKPVSVDVVDLVQGMSDLLRRSLGPTITIEVPRGVHIEPVMMDANQLELALLNLAVNARDAMPRGGVVTIEVAQEVVEAGSAGPEAAHVPPKLAPGRYARISVIDHGEGMDEATLARATEPFYTTKGVGKGTGLGLSMVEGLASQSGGRFVLKSALGVGTTAELWLPVARLPLGASGVEAPQEELPGLGRALAVLVVDDDPLVLANTVAMLEELGHSVRGVTSAQEALDILRAGQHCPQLLLTDHAMPHMTGAALVGSVQPEIPGLAIVLATGYAELNSELPPSVVRLNKPFDLQDLEHAISDAVERAGLG